MTEPTPDSGPTGADVLVATLADHGVRVCFANPGTSEMHLVQALDREARMRSVLCLFEGVATGAADGWARIAGTPAMTLLHLGPGYANGAANIHNARRAWSPMINVIGDHATHHRTLDAPLASDIETLVRPNSRWTGLVERAGDSGDLAKTAFLEASAPPGGPVSLILPADSAWSPGGARPHAATPPGSALAGTEMLDAARDALAGARKPVVLAGANALTTPRGLEAMARLRAGGVRPLMDTFPARQSRGAGRHAPDRMLYFAEMAMEDLAGTDLMLLAGTDTPCAFFAYPGRPSVLVPEGCRVVRLAERHEDAAEALWALAEAMGAPPAPDAAGLDVPAAPVGALTPHACAASLARHLPDNAIVSDDAVTAGLPHYVATACARPHDWLFLTGGAIGQGLPLAVGAALAAPGRKVVALTGDGAAMYTPQALWTLARERLPVVVVVFANRSYRILNIEMARTGAGQPGPSARAMLSLDDPALDWVKLAEAQGVRALRCDTAESYDTALADAMDADHPVLIEAVL